MPTDTERLDWLIAQGGGEWEEPYMATMIDGHNELLGGYWFQNADQVFGGGDPITPRSKDPRKSIDLAIAKEQENG